jgi:hypothetical protein
VTIIPAILGRKNVIASADPPEMRIKMSEIVVYGS